MQWAEVGRHAASADRSVSLLPGNVVHVSLVENISQQVRVVAETARDGVWHHLCGHGSGWPHYAIHRSRVT